MISQCNKMAVKLKLQCKLSDKFFKASNLILLSEPTESRMEIFTNMNQFPFTVIESEVSKKLSSLL